MTMKLTFALVALLWTLGAQANTCDRDCTADGKRVVRAGQTFTGYAHSTGITTFFFTTESWNRGWNLVSAPTSQCTFNIRDFGNTILCFNYTGPVVFEAKSPAKAGVEGEIEVNGKLYLTVDYMTEREVHDAYYRYKTGFCNPDLFSVPKGSLGHIVEAKYVCTNDPDFEEDA